MEAIYCYCMHYGQLKDPDTDKPIIDYQQNTKILFGDKTNFSFCSMLNQMLNNF